MAGRQQGAHQHKQANVDEILERYGQTFAEEAGIRIEHNTPAPLFQLLCLALLLSAPIPAGNALRAIRSLHDVGLTTPRKMARASWQDRVDAITWHGYKRFDESGATKLGACAEHVIERYGGDLRKLREEGAGDVLRLETRLLEFKGIGKVGASIFLREVQLVWDEVYPYVDPKVLRTAQRLGLGRDARSLAKRVPRKDFTRLVAALIRIDLARVHSINPWAA